MVQKLCTVSESFGGPSKAEELIVRSQIYSTQYEHDSTNTSHCSMLTCSLDTIPEMSSIDGGEGPVPERDAGTEALLDIVIAYELIYPQTVNVFSADDTYSADNDLGFMDTTLDALDGSFCTYSAFGQKGDNNTIDRTCPRTEVPTLKQELTIRKLFTQIRTQEDTKVHLCVVPTLPPTSSPFPTQKESSICLSTMSNVNATNG